MNSRALALSASLALGGLLASAPAQATTMVELSLDQKVAAADHIVRGTVQEIWTERAANQHVWTRVQLEVSEVFKGQPGLEAVVVDQLGGEWAGRDMLVHGAAVFDVGEEVVVFLEDLDSGYTAVVGMHQGKYTLKMDPVSREPVAFTTPMRPGQAFDHRFIPLPAEDRRLTVTELGAEIDSALQRGWDGVSIPGVSDEELRSRNPVPAAGDKGVK